MNIDLLPSSAFRLIAGLKNEGDVSPSFYSMRQAHRYTKPSLPTAYIMLADVFMRSLEISQSRRGVLISESAAPHRSSVPFGTQKRQLNILFVCTQTKQYFSRRKQEGRWSAGRQGRERLLGPKETGKAKVNSVLL